MAENIKKFATYLGVLSFMFALAVEAAYTQISLERLQTRLETHDEFRLESYKIHAELGDCAK